MVMGPISSGRPSVEGVPRRAIQRGSWTCAACGEVDVIVDRCLFWESCAGPDAWPERLPVTIATRQIPTTKDN